MDTRVLCISSALVLAPLSQLTSLKNHKVKNKTIKTSMTARAQGRPPSFRACTGCGPWLWLCVPLIGSTNVPAKSILHVPTSLVLNGNVKFRVFGGIWRPLSSCKITRRQLPAGRGSWSDILWLEPHTWVLPGGGGFLSAPSFWGENKDHYCRNGEGLFTTSNRAYSILKQQFPTFRQ